MPLSRPRERLIADLVRLRGACCAGCGVALCGHALLASFALGCKDEPRCIACLARALEQERDGLLGQLAGYVGRRDCYAAAWRWASGREGACAIGDAAPVGPSDDLDGAADARAPSDDRDSAIDAWTLPVAASDDLDRATEAPASPVAASAVWDAGEMGCGDLVLALRQRLLALRPGEVLEVVARDAGAPADLPAWCAMTGHTLVRADPPTYFIRRKSG